MINIGELLKSDWTELWEQVSNRLINTDEEKLIKAFLVGYNWNKRAESYTILETVNRKNSWEYYWVKLMVDISNGIGTNFDIIYHNLKKHNRDEHLLNWAKIEYYGRTENYTMQVDLFIKSIKSDNVFPYIAFINSTNFEEYNFLYILQNYDLSTITISSSVWKILFKIHILDSLNKYKELDKFILKILNFTNDEIILKKVLLKLYINDMRQNIVKNEHLKSLDLSLQLNCFNFEIINNWLKLAISKSGNYDSLKKRVNSALNMVPEILEYKASIVTYALIYFWINNDMCNVLNILNSFSQFKFINAKLDKNLQVYFVYINSLYDFRVLNHERYAKEDKYERLYVIGESHSLSLSNLKVNYHNKEYRCHSMIIMGTKMYHLKKNSNNRFKFAMLEYIESIKENGAVLLTIGEIDCRPYGGIWENANKNNLDLDSVINRTVDDYIDFIYECFKQKSISSIIIQGIPYPNYHIDKSNTFINMIEKVNRRLHLKSSEKKFYFLDTYTTTQNRGSDHIDNYHLKPSFYQNLSENIL